MQAELAGPVATRLLQIPRRARGAACFALVSAACRVRLSGERAGERLGGCAAVSVADFGDPDAVLEAIVPHFVSAARGAEGHATVSKDGWRRLV